MRSTWHAGVALSLIAKPRMLPILSACKAAGDAEPPCRGHDWLGVGLAILLTVPPHPGQEVSPVNIAAESGCLFPPCTAD
jgi:hypothetical protein